MIIIRRPLVPGSFGSLLQFKALVVIRNADGKDQGALGLRSGFSEAVYGRGFMLETQETTSPPLCSFFQEITKRTDHFECFLCEAMKWFQILFGEATRGLDVSLKWHIIRRAYRTVSKMLIFVIFMVRAETHSKDIEQTTRTRIIEEARKLFSEYSFLGVSMSDIAEKLNITKAALYYHFASKTDLYESVLDDVFKRLNLVISDALSEATTEAKLSRLIKGYLEFGFSEKNLIKALVLKLSPENSQVTEQVAKLRMQIGNLISPLVEEIIKGKGLAQEADAKLITSLLLGMMDGLLLEHALLNEELDLENIANSIIAILFKDSKLIASEEY